MREEAGYTLLELLVALVLLGLLGLAVAGLLDVLVRAGEVADRVAARARVDELRLFLDERLARALPVPAGEGRAIRGDGRTLALVTAPLPERLGSGLRAIRLRLEPDRTGTVLEWCGAPMALGTDPLATLATASCRRLGRLPAGGRWRYAFAGAAGGLVWRDRITPADPWPRAVRLDFDPATGRPPWLFPLPIRALGGCAGGGCG